MPSNSLLMPNVLICMGFYVSTFLTEDYTNSHLYKHKKDIS